MKKIGIITMHRVLNYGSVLQTYALWKKLSAAGCAAEVIDYIFPNSGRTGETGLRCWKKRIRTFLSLVLKPARLKRKRKLAGFLEANVRLSARKYKHPRALAEHCSGYDIYMTGSDQVWSSHNTGRDLSFLLPFAPDTAVKVSYAASFGFGEVAESQRHEYRELLSRYHRISVREESGIEKIKDLQVKGDVQVCADPTLLLTREEWGVLAARSRLKIAEPYLLFYILGYSFPVYPGILSILDKMVKDFDGRVIFLGEFPFADRYPGAQVIRDASVEDFLYLFCHASAVLTTSFHGTVFSILFERPFYAVITRNIIRDTRIEELLRRFDLLSQAIVFEDAEKCDFSFPAVDFGRVTDNINIFRKQSAEYLISCTIR